MIINENQAAAISQIINALENIYNTAKHYPCQKGDKIIADAVRVQAYNKLLDAPIAVVKAMLNGLKSD